MRIAFYLLILAMATMVFTAGGPTMPRPTEAPGGYVFSPVPDSVTVYRDTVHVATIYPDQFLELDEGEVFVEYADSTILKLRPGQYAYFVTGHWGKKSASPYQRKSKVREPEAILLVKKADLCLIRGGRTRCVERK